MDNQGSINDIISGKNKIGVNIAIDKESAIILGLVIIGAILIGGLLLSMLKNAFNIN